MCSDLIFGPSFKVKQRQPNFKVLINNVPILGPRGLQCEINLWEIMGWESSEVVRLRLLLHGQTMVH